MIVFLPSRHDGGKIDLVQDEKSASFCTSSHSYEYQYLSCLYDSVIDVAPIISGTRLGLVFYLLYEKNENTIPDTNHSYEDDAFLDSADYDQLSVYAFKQDLLKVRLRPLRQPSTSNISGLLALRKVLKQWQWMARDDGCPSPPCPQVRT
jgi:hypothetical protein